MFRDGSKIAGDAQGRLSVSAHYREQISNRCSGQMVVTVDRDYCLLIYPLTDWEEIERKLMRLPSLNHQARKLQRLMVGYATEVDLDGSGRILLPLELREFAGLARKAVLIGQGNRFELWDEDSWNAKRDAWLQEQDPDQGLTGELESLSL